MAKKNKHVDVEPIEEANVEVEEAVEVEVEELDQEPVFGKVVNCARLNIRKKPDVNSEIMCTIMKDSKVMIDEKESNEEWLKVYTKEGIEGFCMIKFIVTE